MYSYKNSVKSNISDELINTYLIRPVAGIIVWLLYYTPITPNQVTITSIIVGLIAAIFYLQGTSGAIMIAGLIVTLKDVLDSADGQLARAKQRFSRVGRFLDSIGDFIVSTALFSAIGSTLFRLNGNWFMLLLAFLGLVGITLRVSYHVYYQVNYLHLQNNYLINRVNENINEEDLKKGGVELFLQKVFQFIYGWQDTFIARIDSWSYKKTDADSLKNQNWKQLWYSDKVALGISGLIGLGTELFMLMICSILNQLELYLYLNLFLMNGIMLICIFYRKIFLSRRILT